MDEGKKQRLWEQYKVYLDDPQVLIASAATQPNVDAPTDSDEYIKRAKRDFPGLIQKGIDAIEGPED